MHQPCANGGPPPQHVNGDGPAHNGDLPAPATAPSLRLSQTDQEIVRLIGQHLTSIGLERSAALVMEESGLHLEHPAAGRLRAHVLAGDWSKAEHDLRALHELLRAGGGGAGAGCEPRALQEMKFVVLEQKYLEHLEAGRALDALHVLRNELTPLGHDTARVHRLSALMMCGSASELRRAAARAHDGAGPAARAAGAGGAPPGGALPAARGAAPAAGPRPHPLLAAGGPPLLAGPVPRARAAGAYGPLRRGVVLPVGARRRHAGHRLQGQHRHPVGPRPRRQAPLLQEVAGGAHVRRVVPGVEPRRALPAGGGARGLPRPVDLERGDRAAAPQDEPLAGGLADGGGVARGLGQVRVRRRARPVLLVLAGRRRAVLVGRRAGQRAGVPRGRPLRAGRRHAPPRARLRLHRPGRPQPGAGGARRDGDDTEFGRHHGAAQRGQPGRAPLGHTLALAGAAVPRAQPGPLHHPRVLRRRAPGLRGLRQRGQQGVHLAHRRRGARGGGGGAHALRERGRLEPRAPRPARLRVRRLLTAAVGPAPALTRERNPVRRTRVGYNWGLVSPPPQVPEREPRASSCRLQSLERVVDCAGNIHHLMYPYLTNLQCGSAIYKNTFHFPRF